MALGLARLQLQAGLTREAQAALAQVHEKLQRLRRRLEGKTTIPEAPRHKEDETADLSLCLSASG
jgi:hypothetical protein